MRTGSAQTPGGEAPAAKATTESPLASTRNADANERGMHANWRPKANMPISPDVATP